MKTAYEWAKEVYCDPDDQKHTEEIIKAAQTEMQYFALDAAAKLLKQNGRVQAANFLLALVSDLKEMEKGKPSQFPLLQDGGHLLGLLSGRR